MNQHDPEPKRETACVDSVPRSSLFPRKPRFEGIAGNTQRAKNSSTRHSCHLPGARLISAAIDKAELIVTMSGKGENYDPRLDTMSYPSFRPPGPQGAGPGNPQQQSENYDPRLDTMSYPPLRLPGPQGAGPGNPQQQTPFNKLA
ncbi:uncharacterized protein LOC124272824 isoform X2 [Haliotis rubra]|uniref:uncharacterized protein LOC124272824 isoform X2 n=1 Tax=Haliotis rubra TaxID=36100 RepID=UPI001EE56F9A|nr:uncharacterized protein LOC124272824 isoform X2 [Haliotis rubra]